MISHAHIYGRMGDSRAHIYTPITAVVVIPDVIPNTILPQYSGAGLWSGRKLNEKKVVDRKINYEMIDDDNDVLTIVTFLINIQNGGIR